MSKAAKESVGSENKEKACATTKASSTPIGDSIQKSGDASKTSKITPEVKIAAKTFPPTTQPILETPNLISKTTKVSS